MPIRPIDLQVILPKAQNNPLNREHVVNKEALQLQQMQQENKKEATIKDNKVNALKHKEPVKVEAKKEKDEGQSKKQSASKKDGKETGADSKDDTSKNKKPPLKGLSFNRFDMKV